MTPDALRGKDAYRCGCGARVKIAIPDTKRCAGYRDGHRCRSTPIAGLPVDLCAEHADELRNLWRLDFSERQREWTEGEYRPEILARRNEARQKLWDACQDPVKRPDPPCVYYLQFGDRIKIGTTTNLTQRLRDIPHDKLLATEPGNETMERRRHRQFAALRITGEWFRAERELLAHIAGLAPQTQATR